MKTPYRGLRHLLRLCFALQLGFFVLAWSSVWPGLGSWSMQITAKGLGVTEMHNLSMLQRSFGIALGLPALLSLCYGLWRVDRMLGQLTQSTIFNLDNIAHLRAFAGGVALATLLAILEAPARTLVFRLLPGNAKTTLAIGLSSEELMLLLVCSLFYLIVNMMHEGRRLAEENQGFI